MSDAEVSIKSASIAPHSMRAFFEVKTLRTDTDVIIPNIGPSMCDTCGTACLCIAEAYRSKAWGEVFLGRTVLEELVTGEEGIEASSSADMMISIPWHIIIDPEGEVDIPQEARMNSSYISLTLTYRPNSVAIWVVGEPDLFGVLRNTIRAGVSVLYYVGSIPHDARLSTVAETIWTWAKLQRDEAKECKSLTHNPNKKPHFTGMYNGNPELRERVDSYAVLTRGVCLACLVD